MFVLYLLFDSHNLVLGKNLIVHSYDINYETREVCVFFESLIITDAVTFRTSFSLLSVYTWILALSGSCSVVF